MMSELSNSCFSLKEAYDAVHLTKNSDLAIFRVRPLVTRPMHRSGLTQAPNEEVVHEV